MSLSIARTPDEIRAMLEAADQVALDVAGEARPISLDEALDVVDIFERHPNFKGLRLFGVRPTEDNDDDTAFLVFQRQPQ